MTKLNELTTKATPARDFAQPKSNPARLAENFNAGVNSSRLLAHDLSSTRDESSKKSFVDYYIKDTKNRNLFLSYINAALHGLATLTAFSNMPVIKVFNTVFDKTAFLFTRWVAPLTSYGLAALQSLMKNDLPETIIKAIPPLLLPFVGDANVDTVYGLSTALNQPYDLVAERVRNKKHLSQDHKNFAEGKGKSWGVNWKLIKDEAKIFFKEFKEGKLDFWDKAIYLYNCPLILGGSLPMLLFARKSRDSELAKILGLLRNIGGVMGDVGFLVGKNEIYKKLVGVMCSISAGASVAKRWVKSDKLARAFIHLSAALDVSAMALWNTFSGTRDEAKAAPGMA